MSPTLPGYPAGAVLVKPRAISAGSPNERQNQEPVSKMFPGFLVERVCSLRADRFAATSVRTVLTAGRTTAAAHPGADETDDGDGRVDADAHGLGP
jgi:hypothetical protein